MSEKSRQGEAPSDLRSSSEEEATRRQGPSTGLIQASAAPDTGSESRSGLSPTNEAAPAAGTVLASRYTVLQVLGEGGMGVVMAAYDARLDRRVALKLLRATRTWAGESTTEMRGRMLREAHAMARLNHPNVVSVYDAGELDGGRIFIAMEMVEGQTLKRWAREPGRTWRDVLKAYVEAGQGLAAAHAAGLVHRDFKPDNVLVGTDGRVKVTDFGVARTHGSVGPPTVPVPLTVPETPSGSSLTPTPMSLRTPLSYETRDSSLTVPGTVVGTPKYMAPELWRGQPADTRSDLFSFCVALYESLYGQHAFPGHGAERQKAQRAGQISPVPAQTQVPAWVTRQVLRGLSAEPEQRPPSMEALLTALQDDPLLRRRARMRVAAVALTVIGLAGVAAWGWVGRRGPSCGEQAERLAGIWDDSAKKRVREALMATGLTYAAITAEKVEATLEKYGRDWGRMRVEACEASRGSGDSPSSLGVLQAGCLERRREHLKLLVEVFSRGPDPELMPRAVLAAESLPPLTECKDEKALLAAVPPPTDPAHRARVEALRAKVDKLEVLISTGKFREGSPLADALEAEVEAVDYAPVQARALLHMGRMKSGAGDFEGALALARRALKPAAHGHEDIVVARALNLIAHVRGIKQLQFKEMLELRPYWETIVERHGGDREQVEMLSILGSILTDAEQYDEALRVLERARTLADKTFGPDSLLLTGVLNSLGVLYGDMGRYEDARATHQRVLAIRNKMLGADHPFVGTTLNNIGLVFYNEGRHTESFDSLERAIAVRRKALGKEHFEVAVALFNAGRNLWYLARYTDAQAYFDEARAIFEKTRGRSEVYIGNYHIGTADLLLDQGKPAEAREHFLKARAIFERTVPNSVFEADRGVGASFFEQGRYAEAKAVQQPLVEKIFKKDGDDDQFLAARRVELARTLMRLGDLNTAEGLLEKARAAVEKEVGPKASQLSFPLFAQGELHLFRKQLALAITTLESALLLAPPKLRPHVELALAQAMQQAGKDRERAATLAREARDFYKRIGNQPKAAGAERWVAGNAVP